MGGGGGGYLKYIQSREGGGSLEPRTAIELSFSAGGGLEKPNRDRGETFFPDSGSDLDRDETFQISRNLGLELDEIVCLLDSQPWLEYRISDWRIKKKLKDYGFKSNKSIGPHLYILARKINFLTITGPTPKNFMESFIQKSGKSFAQNRSLKVLVNTFKPEVGNR